MENKSGSVTVTATAFIARPIIQWDHVDGPLLTWAGRSHWLTWWERLLYIFGLTDEEKLGHKRFGRPLKFVVVHDVADSPPQCLAGRPMDCFFLVENYKFTESDVAQPDYKRVTCITCGEEWVCQRSGQKLIFRRLV